MKNRKSLLNYAAIPLFGIGALVSSCDFYEGDNSTQQFTPQTYDLKVRDVNNDGLKDLIIRDSRGEIKDIFVQKNDGKYFSLNEVYRQKYREEMIKNVLGKKSEGSKNKKDDEGIFFILPAYYPYFFPTNP